MFIVTGGAGFIGSNIVAALEKRGEDVVVVDWLGSGDHKWRNIAKRRLRDIIRPELVESYIEENSSVISGVFHMGAISATTETDVDLIVSSNVTLSLRLWEVCAKFGIPFVYASSAATYGDGEQGFEDRFDDEYLSKLRPLNAYGWSKHLFDRMVRDKVTQENPAPPVWAGLKFFNVFGPNEYHKGSQQSVAVQLFAQIKNDSKVGLFKSENPHYEDGGQLRDFVWVGDCVDVALWAMDGDSQRSGLYNVGSGVARSFRNKAEIIFDRMNVEVDIKYIELPTNLRGKYQYYTCAPLEKLQSRGYDRPFTSLEDGLTRYVGSYLSAGDPYI